MLKSAWSADNGQVTSGGTNNGYFYVGTNGYTHGFGLVESSRESIPIHDDRRPFLAALICRER